METGIRGDLEWGTVPGLARSAAARFGAAEAVVDGDVRLSFDELAAAADRAGRAFLAAGVRKGDRVAIWSPNIHEWIVALLGLQSAGGWSSRSTPGTRVVRRPTSSPRAGRASWSP